jgi:CelD/BcsL family acetyltransferase involved in cellulose biosynthesis
MGAAAVDRARYPPRCGSVLLTVDVSVEIPRPGLFLDEWDALARTSQSGVFATAEWHEAVQKAYADHGRPAVVAVREHGRLVGVAPFRFRSGPLIRGATWLGMGEGGYGLGDYAGIVAARGREQDVADAVISWLAAKPGWDLLDLQQLPPGPVTQALLQAIPDAGLRSLVRRHNICHVIELPSTWAAYRSKLSPGARDWLERKPRKAERELGATIERIEPDRLLEEYSTMRRFQAKRFGDQSPESERKLATVISAWLPLAHERNWLRMFRLRSGSRTIGVLLGYEYERVFYFHSAAFESPGDGAKYSLGASLLAGALRYSIDHGLERFDMLRGHYDYKVRLGSERRYNYRVMVFRNSLMGRAIEAAIQVRTMAKRKRPWKAGQTYDGTPDGSERTAHASDDLASSAVGVE